ncbi:hypothetical protein AVEN_99606-1 [Araneus ventricosus]|uniref:Uncharacterized protein n=1 Tax=Araneus ventricosus TaxID=182803 RepID=A0A4Y2ET86_ARAVE|nr:hypothetical protein AVEN_99606-1 [Araneus ventricosus]
MYQREQILFAIMLTMVKVHVIKYHKKTSPRPGLEPGFILNDGRHDFFGNCGLRIIAPITRSSRDDPPFYRGTIHHQRWALRATPPLLHPPRERDLLTYPAASHP